MRQGSGGRVRTTEERGGCVAQANGEVDASDGVGEQGGLRGRRGSLGSPTRNRRAHGFMRRSSWVRDIRIQTRVRTAHARPTWRKRARRQEA